jgi:hypothetical protein
MLFTLVSSEIVVWQKPSHEADLALFDGFIRTYDPFWHSKSAGRPDIVSSRTHESSSNQLLVDGLEEIRYAHIQAFG